MKRKGIIPRGPYRGQWYQILEPVLGFPDWFLCMIWDAESSARRDVHKRDLEGEDGD